MIPSVDSPVIRECCRCSCVFVALQVSLVCVFVCEPWVSVLCCRGQPPPVPYCGDVCGGDAVRVCLHTLSSAHCQTQKISAGSQQTGLPQITEHLSQIHFTDRFLSSAQMSADYETMMPRVRNQPETCCTCPDCVELSALSSPPRGVCASLRSKQRESAISTGLSEYAVVSVLEHSCQDQCLDVNQIEEKVYQDLGGVKDERAVWEK